jgi:hypothetical protein
MVPNSSILSRKKYISSKKNAICSRMHTTNSAMDIDRVYRPRLLNKAVLIFIGTRITIENLSNLNAVRSDTDLLKIRLSTVFTYFLVIRLLYILRILCFFLDPKYITERVQQMRTVLPDKINAHAVSATMYEYQALNDADKESIRCEVNTVKAAAALLEAVLRNKQQQHIWEKFLTSLVVNKQEYIALWILFGNHVSLYIFFIIFASSSDL